MQANHIELALMGAAISISNGLWWALVDTGWTGERLATQTARYTLANAAAFLLYVLLGFRVMYGPVDLGPASLHVYADSYVDDMVFQASFAAQAAGIVVAIGFRTARLALATLAAAVVAGLAYPALARLEWSRDAIPGFYDFAGGTLVYGFAAAAGVAASITTKTSNATPTAPARPWLIAVAAIWGPATNALVLPAPSLLPTSQSAVGAANVLAAVTGVCLLVAVLTWYLVQRLRRRPPWFALWAVVALPAVLASGLDQLSPSHLLLVSALFACGAAFLVETLRPTSLELAFGCSILLASTLGSLANATDVIGDHPPGTLLGQALGTLLFLLGGAVAGGLAALPTKLPALRH